MELRFWIDPETGLPHFSIIASPSKKK